MKAISTLAIALSLIALTSAKSAILITEVNPSGSGTLTYGADWFELTNTGTSAVDVTNWRVDDSSAAFASAVTLTGITSIAAGESVIFLETSDDADLQAFRTAWFGTTSPNGLQLGKYSGSGIGLSTSSDSVVIYNASGTQIARVNFGTAPSGATFDNSAGLNGVTISQASTVGVNGAFTSFNGAEIGSPGNLSAVPEPSSVALAAGAAAFFALHLFRRRKTA
jgi:hypothetical protein